MVVSLAYLSLIHLHRLLYEAGNYALDVTGNLPIEYLNNFKNENEVN